MRIGAYQFAVTGSIGKNFARIQKGVEEAEKAGVRLLLYPECALTGYPPHSVGSVSEVDHDAVDRAFEALQALASERRMYLIVGTVLREGSRYFNSAVIFRPDGKREAYGKRALWGWDRDNFTEGQDLGLVDADGLRVGVRICFEVRFPEYFRELYRQGTDLDLILFYDVSDREDGDRYSLIAGHIRTRAVENVCPILTCNTCSPFQTAPTALVDRSGKLLAELEQGKEGLLVYDLERRPLGFGEQGRKEITDALLR